MPSTPPTPPRWPIVLAPPPDGLLICLWLTHECEALYIARSLARLIILPTCGVQTWDHTSRTLFVVWATDEQAPLIRGLFSAYGEVQDWPYRLPLSGHWTPFGGTPLFAEHEYEEVTPC